MVEKQPTIKDVQVINTYKVVIDGDEYVKRKSFVTELEHVINHVHFIITGSDIHIDGNICFRCGNIFEKEITSHHSLPRMLKAKYNVFVPLCSDCHLDLNKMYKNGGD